MEGYVAVLNKGTAYLSKKDLAAELGYTKQTISKLIDGVREEIRAGRYHPYVIAGNRYNFYAVIDYMKYKDQLADKNMRKCVPAFDPVALAELCGFHMKLIREEVAV